MVNTKYVMRYNEKLLTQFWKKAKAISHRGKNILLVFDDCIGLVNWMGCIFKQATKWSRKAVHDSYGKDYGSVKEFVDYMNSLPKYGFICVDTCKGGSEKYKKMKAPAKIPRFYYGNNI